MGCGRSKLQSIYPRHRNSGASSKNKHNNTDQEKCSENGSAVSGGHDQNASGSGEEQQSPESRRKAAMARGRQFITSPALFAMTEASTSQEDFFKMLDEKIENGADYDSSSEPSRATSPCGVVQNEHASTRPPRPTSAHGKHRYPTVLASPSRRQVSSRPPQRLLPTLQASPPPHEPKS